MPSPFPGMDPYLEAAHIWEDFHANLAMEIQRQLAPGLRPRYVAALIPTVTYDEVLVEKTYRVKPEVSIWQIEEQPWSGEAVTIAPAPVHGYVTLEEPIKLHNVEIRKAATGLLVTAIEILSPVNKRPSHEAFEDYRRKRRDLLRSSVHLMEIDLLRAGHRPPLVAPLPEAPYFIFLHRGDHRPKVEIWPLRLQNSIPLLPVPLLFPDPDVPLNLGRAIQTIYEALAYDMRLDYQEPPPKPDLSPEEAEWITMRLQSLRKKN